MCVSNKAVGVQIQIIWKKQVQKEPVDTKCGKTIHLKARTWDSYLLALRMVQHLISCEKYYPDLCISSQNLSGQQATQPTGKASQLSWGSRIVYLKPKFLLASRKHKAKK